MELCSSSGKEQKSQDSEMHVFDRKTERIQCFFSQVLICPHCWIINFSTLGSPLTLFHPMHLTCVWFIEQESSPGDGCYTTICLVCTYNYAPLWLYRNNANPNGEQSNFHAEISVTLQAHEEAQVSSFGEVALHHVAAVWENQKCNFPYDRSWHFVFSFAPPLAYPPDFSFMLLSPMLL